MSNNITLSDRLNFFEIDEQTKTFIQSLKPFFEENLNDVLDSFYGHVGKWTDLSSLFRDKRHMDHAKQKQYEHWMNHIVSGELGPRYEESVRIIGKTHHRLNLEPFWYIGGYSKLADELILLVNDKMADGFVGEKNKKLRTKALQTIVKAMMFDMGFAINVYLEEGLKERENVLVSISSSVEETSSNVSTIAASIEELTRSSDGMSERVGSVATLTSESNAAVEDTVMTVRNLEEAAEEINNVVAMIEDIAEQTNLLALNATIEAARSGEAGKGIAVVANEVKALASQTSQAIGGVSDKVTTIRDVTSQTVDAINQIAEHIKKVDTETVEMREDIQEQAKALQEIAKNTEEAAQGATEVSGSIQAMQRGIENPANDAAGVQPANADPLAQAAE